MINETDIQSTDSSIETRPQAEAPAAAASSLEAPASESGDASSVSDGGQGGEAGLAGGAGGSSFAWNDLELKTPVELPELIEAGAHFGHQTKRWNPRMAPYIYGSRNGIHIIDLDQTLSLMTRAFRFLAETVSKGGHVLFVGTKPQAVEIVGEEAERGKQFFVTGRWLGGTLTNFRTVRGSIEELHRLEEVDSDGSLDLLIKKEALSKRRAMGKLNKYLGGIKNMPGVPSAMLVVDPNQEHIAVSEARKLHIPIVALTDTNCNPEPVDYVIPCNDDSIRSVRLVVSRLADACLLGLERRGQRSAAKAAEQQGGDGVRVEFSRGRRGGQGQQGASARH